LSDLLIKRSAIISECGLYRPRLDRDLGFPGLVAAILGVNPSTADGETDDATIRKDYGFCRRNGIGRFIKGNKFAFRATDVRELRAAADPIGPTNDAYLEQMMREADIVIAAWGPLSKLPPHLRGRWKRVASIARDVGKPLYCFGTAQDGQPRHTLMLAYDTPLVEWRPLDTKIAA
jgi:hypothetical protein